VKHRLRELKLKRSLSVLPETVRTENSEAILGIRE
jgi:hypothetical protein